MVFSALQCWSGSHKTGGKLPLLFWVDNNSWGFQLKYLSRRSHIRWNFIPLLQVFFCLYVKYGLTESQEQRKRNLVDVFVPLIGESIAADVTVIHLPALTPSALCVQVLKNRNRHSFIDSFGISLHEPQVSSPSPQARGGGRSPRPPPPRRQGWFSQTHGKGRGYLSWVRQLSHEGWDWPSCGSVQWGEGPASPGSVKGRAQQWPSDCITHGFYGSRW